MIKIGNEAAWELWCKVRDSGTASPVLEFASELQAEVLRLNGGGGEAVPYSGADESPPVFGRRWSTHPDGFGFKRNDTDGNYVHIDDALSVLHQWQQEAERKAINFCKACSVALAVPQPQQAEPGAVLEGWQLVPVEPTPKMISAAWKQGVGGGWDMEGPEPIYRAMLSAAPKPAHTNEPIIGKKPQGE